MVQEGLAHGKLAFGKIFWEPLTCLQQLAELGSVGFGDCGSKLVSSGVPHQVRHARRAAMPAGARFECRFSVMVRHMEHLTSRKAVESAWVHPVATTRVWTHPRFLLLRIYCPLEGCPDSPSLVCLLLSLQLQSLPCGEGRWCRCCSS